MGWRELLQLSLLWTELVRQLPQALTSQVPLDLGRRYMIEEGRRSSREKSRLRSIKTRLTTMLMLLLRPDLLGHNSRDLHLPHLLVQIPTSSSNSQFSVQQSKPLIVPHLLQLAHRIFHPADREQGVRELGADTTIGSECACVGFDVDAGEVVAMKSPGRDKRVSIANTTFATDGVALMKPVGSM